MSPKPRFALVRPPGNSFYRAVSDHQEKSKIDPARARRQHEEYCYLLEDMVGQVIVLGPEERFPDSCFTQDMAIVVDRHALMARTGIPTRYGESPTIAAALKPLVDKIDVIPPPGTHEGGDVVRLGRRLLVGISRRTSASGMDTLAGWAEPLGYEVVGVRVPSGILHLSTAITAINDRLVMGLPEVLADEVFDSVATLPVTDSPLEACNVLVVGDRIIASGDYAAHALLEKEGYTVYRPDLTEFIRADAGPTCLTILID